MKVKGFTIVELAIVLVVIGIILGMAVKGKSLVDAARVKADLARIHKVESATAIYYAKTGGELPVLNPLMPERREILDMELLTERDVNLEILHMNHPTSGAIMNRIYLTGCLERAYVDDPATMGFVWAQMIDTTQNTRFVAPFSIACLTIGEQTAPAVGSPTALGPIHFFVCHVEVALDDMNDRAGTMRQGYDSVVGARLTDFSDCDSLRYVEQRETVYYKTF